MKKFPKSKKHKKQRLAEIIEILKEDYPEAKIQLQFRNDFQLMVATILSAKCTDKRVNIVTKDLFRKYPDVEDYVGLKQEVLEKEIYSTGYYKAKAKHIIAAANTLLSDFGGKVPGSMEELLKVPGVGRKTANVLLGHLYGIPAIVVDTHVIKLMNRLGIMDTKNPEVIERSLSELIPKKYWVMFTHYMISHGRTICTARKPKCHHCRIEHLCPSGEEFYLTAPLGKRGSRGVSIL